MKVAIIVFKHAREARTGGAVVAYDHAQALSKLGIETFFFAGRVKPTIPPAPILEQIAQGTLTEYLFSLDALRASPINHLGEKIIFSALNQELRKIDPDVIHFHTITSFGLNVFEEVRTPKAKIVYTTHASPLLCENYAIRHRDDNSLCEMIDPKSCIRCFPGIHEDVFTLRRKVAFECVERLDMLVSPGKITRERHIKAGISPDRIRFIPNGVSMRAVPSAERSNKDDLHLAFIGRNTEVKGLDLLLTAFDMLESTIKKNIHLHIVGPIDANPSPQIDHPLSEYYINTVQRLLDKNKESITLYGELGPEKIPAILAQVDCLVAPSRVPECRPLVVIEAFTCRKPVICSNFGGFLEMVRENIDGIYFEKENAHDLSAKIQTLYTDKNILKELCENILPQRTEFDMARDYLDLYRELLPAEDKKEIS